MRFQMSITTEMAKALQEEAKKRKLAAIQETIRTLLGEYFMLEGRAKEKEKKEPRRTIKLDDINPLAH